jgi:tetratricopeptide (TPR) repeat protein
MSHKKTFITIFISFCIVSLCFTGCVKDEPIAKEITITTNSNDALKLFLEGRDMSEKLKFPQAAVMFDKAIALDKDFAMAYLYRANSGGGYKIVRENLTKAEELLNKVSDGEKHLILYNKSLYDGDAVKQKQELDSLLLLYPDDKRVQNLAGIYYYGLQDYPNALKHFDKAVAIDNKYASSYNMLGYVYMGMKNFSQAEEPFKKYIELIPNEANPYDSYAEYLLMQGRYDESIKQYEKALEIDPEYITAMIGVGNNYVFKGEFNKARTYYQQYYDKALNINQKFAALWWKAVSYVYENNFSEAIKILEERSKLALDNDAPNYVINGNIYSGLIMIENGNITEGEKYFNNAFDFTKAADIDNATRKTFEIYNGLDKCHLKILKKDFDGAEKDLEAIKVDAEKRQDPNEIKYLNLIYGILQYNKGNFGLALEYFNKADKESPYTWYWEANAQEKAGNTQEAKKIYEKIASSNINSMELALVRNKAIMKL